MLFYVYGTYKYSYKTVSIYRRPVQGSNGIDWVKREQKERTSRVLLTSYTTLTS